MATLAPLGSNLMKASSGRKRTSRPAALVPSLKTSRHCSGPWALSSSMNSRYGGGGQWNSSAAAVLPAGRPDGTIPWAARAAFRANCAFNARSIARSIQSCVHRAAGPSYRIACPFQILLPSRCMRNGHLHRLRIRASRKGISPSVARQRVAVRRNRAKTHEGHPIVGKAGLVDMSQQSRFASHPIPNGRRNWPNRLRSVCSQEELIDANQDTTQSRQHLIPKRPNDVSEVLPNR